MNATVALTGQGGWPMTCFLTPDGRPFFCGTYYPKPQLPAAARRGHRDLAAPAATRSSRPPTRSPASCGRWRPGCPAAAPPVQPALCDHAVAAVLRRRGRRARRVRRRAEVPAVGAAGGAAAQPRTHRRRRRRWRRSSAPATAMARGGIYDQLAGGFARYSVDASWVVPHFEKMLYDNALLLRVYAHWARRTGNPLARKVTGETARFLIDELGADGMFISSLDADADGHEGLTYVWTPGAAARGARRRRRALGGRAFRRHRRRARSSTAVRCCSCRADPDDAERFERVRDRAAGRPVDPAAARPRRQGRHRVERAGDHRARRGRCRAGPARTPRCRNALRATLLDLHLVDGRLRRASLGGVVGDSAAILEDYATLATGLLTLYQLTGEASWLDAATGLLDIALGHFADPGPRRPLVRHRRRRRAADGPARRPARRRDPVGCVVDRRGAASLAAHLVAADRAERYAAAADATLAGATPLLARAAALGRALAGSRRGRGARTDPDRRGLRPADSELLAAARRWRRAARSSSAAPVNSSELLIDRDRVDGADAAYVCRGRVCDLPVTTAEDLAAALGALRVACAPCRALRTNAKTVNRYLELVADRHGRRHRRALRRGRHRRGSGRRRGAHRPPGDPRLLHERSKAARRRPNC